jgi:hypothetical protein
LKYLDHCKPPKKKSSFRLELKGKNFECQNFQKGYVPRQVPVWRYSYHKVTCHPWPKLAQKRLFYPAILVSMLFTPIIMPPAPIHKNLEVADSLIICYYPLISILRIRWSVPWAWLKICHSLLFNNHCLRSLVFSAAPVDVSISCGG